MDDALNDERNLTETLQIQIQIIEGEKALKKELLKQRLTKEEWEEDLCEAKKYNGLRWALKTLVIMAGGGGEGLRREYCGDAARLQT